MDYIDDDKDSALKPEREITILQPPDDVLDLCTPFLPCEIMLKNHWLGGLKEDIALNATIASELTSNVSTFPSSCPNLKVQTNSASDEVLFFECSLCSYSTLNISDLRSHEKSSHSSDSDKAIEFYRCSLCSYAAININDLKSHQKNSHGTDSNKTIEYYRCSLCDFQTTMKRNLVRHELNHCEQKRYSCDECDYQNNSRILLNKHKRNHVIGFRNSKFKCPICEFGSNDKECWKLHVVTHDRVRLHECEQCDYSTTKLSDIKRHRGMHSKNDPNYSSYRIAHRMNDEKSSSSSDVSHRDQPTNDFNKIKMKCDKCSYSTHYKGLLTSHILGHEERKQLTCSECGYKTSYRFRLKNHMATHKPDKPYKCSLCNFETRHKVSLPRHILNCHKDISIIKYK